MIYFNYPDFAYISERVMMMKHFSLKMAAVALAMVTAMPLAQPMLSNNTASAIDYYDSIKEIDPSIYTYLEREDGTLAVRTMPTNQKVLEIPAEVEGIPVTEINVLAFRNTIAEEIRIPQTITNVEAISFFLAKHLKTFVVDEEHPTLSVSDGVLYDKTGETLVAYPLGRTDTSYTIAEGVKIIGAAAFFRNPVLEQLTLASTTTHIQDTVFYGCEALNEVVGMEQIETIGSLAFYKVDTLLRTEGDFRMVGDWVVGWSDDDWLVHAYDDNASAKEELVVPDGTIGIIDTLFSGFDNMTTVTLPDSLRAIPMGAFVECKKLQSIHIPENVASIGEYAFASCHALETVYLPADFDVTQIPENAFRDCPALKTVYIGGEASEWLPDTSAEENETQKISSSGSGAHNISTPIQSEVLVIDGDVNEDGKTTIADVVLVQRWLVGEPVEFSEWKCADFTLDGKLTAEDLTLMKRYLPKYVSIEDKVNSYFDNLEKEKQAQEETTDEQ